MIDGKTEKKETADVLKHWSGIPTTIARVENLFAKKAIKENNLQKPAVSNISNNKKLKKLTKKKNQRAKNLKI